MDCNPSAKHTTKAAIFVQHAVLTLEMQSQSLLMGGNVPLESFSIRVMDPVEPFLRSVSDFSFLVPQHGLPTRREMHNVSRKIPVPQAIVRATCRQRVALFAFLQCLPRLFVR